MKWNLGAKIKALFTGRKFDETTYEELEDALIEGDLGGKTAMEISDAVRAKAKEEKLSGAEDYRALIKSILSEKISEYHPEPPRDSLSLYLFLGVNGVGKTTTVAKLASYYRAKNNRVVLAAADTFRAAAIDQLSLHAERLGVRIVKQSDGSDPGAVVYDAITSAQARGDNLILADTAGRMHNKENLVRELQKIDKIAAARIPAENYKKFLVIDATTGQNGFSQAELFNKAVGIDALILTKYDSMAKGGALIRIGEQLGIPVAFVGTGEKYGDIAPFDKDSFLNALCGVE